MKPPHILKIIARWGFKAWMQQKKPPHIFKFCVTGLRTIMLSPHTLIVCAG